WEESQRAARRIRPGGRGRETKGGRVDGVRGGASVVMWRGSDPPVAPRCSRRGMTPQNSCRNCAGPRVGLQVTWPAMAERSGTLLVVGIGDIHGRFRRVQDWIAALE